MRQSPQRLGDGVFAVDTEHVRREADASYLIVDGGRAAFVDTGSHRSVPNLPAALEFLHTPGHALHHVPSHAARAHPPQTRIGCSASSASCSRLRRAA